MYRGSGSTTLPRPIRVRMAVVTGGAVGTGAHLLVARGAPTTLWPWGTFFVNVTGAFLLGYLLTRILQAGRQTTTLVPLVGIGLIGSYTTFSSLALEIHQLWSSGFEVLGLAYAASSLGAGVLLTTLGMRLAGRHP